MSRYGASSGAEVTPHALSHYVQWIHTSAVREGARRTAPLGPAWIVDQLASGTNATIVHAAATELRNLDAQRKSWLSTNLVVDQAQTKLVTDTVARLISRLETLDTSKVDKKCGQSFATTTALVAAKNAWRAQIDALAKSSKTDLLDWIIGKHDLKSNATIKAAAKEAKDQIDCLRTKIKADSSLADPVTSRDPVRNFDKQLCIWFWKFFFRDSVTGLVPPCKATDSTWSFGWMIDTHVAAIHTAMPTATSDFSAGAEWSLSNTNHKTAWASHLSDVQREKEILQTSSAPGISRHHWGTDVDLAEPSPKKWETDALHKALYTWLQKHAMARGFVQVYTPDRPGYVSNTPDKGYDGYIEERWHWSYYPVAQALLEWASVAANKTDIEAHLKAAWADVGTNSSYATARTTVGWTSSTNPFAHIEANWKDFFFNVNRYVTPPVV